MVRVHIKGFRGPWGWVRDFETWCDPSKIKICSSDDVDIIFQTDPTDWQQSAKHLGKKIIIANVLDFAEWVGGNEKTEEYVNEFCKKATKVTGISNKVIDQLKFRGIDASMFYYPSQVDDSIIKIVEGIPKHKKVISFCRLGDPGKGIKDAVDAFDYSKISSDGWLYILTGPEPPTFSLPDGVRYLKYMGRDILYRFVASSKATLMPSFGEGLGLPAIESLLVGTMPIVRRIDPVQQIMGDQAIYVNDFDEFAGVFLNLESGVYDDKKLDVSSVSSWNKTRAFELLEHSLLSLHSS